MAIKDISFYQHAFTHLRRASQHGGAPHKPVLLLAVIKGFENELFRSDKLYITPEFVGLFRSIWHNYVDSPHHIMRFYLPYFHLKNEKADFWNLVPKLGYESWVMSNNIIRSFNKLKKAVDYVRIDKELVELLQRSDTRETLKKSIVDKYFPAHSGKDNSDNYLNDISSQILHDSAAVYRNRIQQMQSELPEEVVQEEIYVRSGQFRYEVLHAYDNTCAISRLKIDIDSNETNSMVDACHIIPFSETHDDTISNGIALTPTLHRAFDRGLLGINTDLKVVLSSNFEEVNSSPYNLSQFAGKQIFIPNHYQKRPSIDKLRLHLAHYFPYLA